MRSHRHFFATLHDLFVNLPERFALETWAQTPEHFRRYLLIRAGYHDAVHYACQSKAEAQRLAVAIRPLDQFCVVALVGETVVRFIARSQSVKAMGKADFQESKDRVLALAETLVEGGELPRMAA